MIVYASGTSMLLASVTLGHSSDKMLIPGLTISPGRERDRQGKGTEKYEIAEKQ